MDAKTKAAILEGLNFGLGLSRTYPFEYGQRGRDSIDAALALLDAEPTEETGPEDETSGKLWAALDDLGKKIDALPDKGPTLREACAVRVAQYMHGEGWDEDDALATRDALRRMRLAPILSSLRGGQR